MAVVVKNTFLDVAGHTFLCPDEPCSTDRRSNSVPRTWKPVMPCSAYTKGSSSSRSSILSTSSNISFSSTHGGLSRSSSASSFESSCASDGAAMTGECSTPASSLESPRGSVDETEICGVCAPSVSLLEIPQEIGDEADTSLEVEIEDVVSLSSSADGPRTKLKVAAPAFQPMTADSRIEAAANAVYLALASSGQTSHVKIEKSDQRSAPVLISVELESGPGFSTRCYDVVHLARQTLEEITTRLENVILLGKRVQREAQGYSLRSSIACTDKIAKNRMCWDLFSKGYCPRRCNCHWYHPQEADIGRIKVVVRCAQNVAGVSSESLPSSGLPAARQTISLGQLV